MLNYQQFLSESLNDLNRMDPFIVDFLEKLKGLPEKAKLSGDIIGSHSCWWCLSSKEFLESIATNIDAPVWATMLAAEKEEGIQRKKPLSQKTITPYYVIEFVIQLQPNSHIYRLIGINMEERSLLVKHDMGGLEDKIEEIFDDVLKTHYPTTRASRKYGLDR